MINNKKFIDWYKKNYGNQRMKFCHDFNISYPTLVKYLTNKQQISGKNAIKLEKLTVGELKAAELIDFKEEKYED